jgi:HNH endonuclease
VTAGGYVQIVVPLDDPLILMADKRGRIFEHRLVMARHLGRVLLSEEHVHHRNGDKQDNRLENLELTSLALHSAAHHKEIRYLRARVQELERELAAEKAKAP